MSVLPCLWIHPHQLPMVSVEIVKAPAVHEAVVLRVHRVRPSGGDRLIHDRIHFGAAAARQREQSLVAARRVARLAPGEGSEERFGQQHDEGHGFMYGWSF